MAFEAAAAVNSVQFALDNPTSFTCIIPRDVSDAWPELRGLTREQAIRFCFMYNELLLEEVPYWLWGFFDYVMELPDTRKYCVLHTMEPLLELLPRPDPSSRKRSLGRTVFAPSPRRLLFVVTGIKVTPCKNHRVHRLRECELKAKMHRVPCTRLPISCNNSVHGLRVLSPPIAADVDFYELAEVVMTKLTPVLGQGHPDDIVRYLDIRG